MQTSSGTERSSVQWAEVDYRIGCLLREAEVERLTRPRYRVRQHVGHAIMALGAAIHGAQGERASRPALDAG